MLHWLLYVGDDGSQAVVATTDPLGFTPDEDAPASVAGPWIPDTNSTVVVAETFEEFLYRFWIENEIWFALADPDGARPLRPQEARYVAHYRG